MNRPMILRWYPRGGQTQAWYSVAVEAYAAKRLGGERAGVRLLAGSGEDRGKFALQIVPYDRNDRTVWPTWENRGGSGSYFHAVGLGAICAKARVILTEMGDYLIGEFPREEGMPIPGPAVIIDRSELKAARRVRRA